jgi:anti-sigma B factor antagonist
VDPLEFRLTSAHIADRTYVVTVGGELDLANAGELDRELEQLVEASADQVIVDLLDVPFLESTALGVLLRHTRALRTNGRELTLVSDDVRVARVIEIAGLTSHLRLAKTLREAIDDALARAYT